MNLKEVNEEREKKFLARSNDLLKTAQEKLHKGDAYTYTELCRLLGEDPLKGYPKTRHLEKELSRIFDFEKADNYFIITEVYNEVKDEPPGGWRKERKDAVYGKYVEYLLLNDLYFTEGNVIECSKREWWKRLRMVNINYGHYYKMEARGRFINDFRNSENFPHEIDDFNNDEFIESNLDKFYSRTGKRFSQIFMKALRRLEDMRFIHFEYVYMISDGKHGVWVADHDEIENWLTCERLALEEFGYRHMRQVYQKDADTQEKFYGVVDEYKKKLFGWTCSYKLIRVVFTKEGMDRAIKKSEESINEIREKMNRLVVTTANEQAIRDADKDSEYSKSPLLDSYRECYNALYGNEILNDERIQKNSKLYAQLIFADKLINQDKSYLSCVS